MSIYFIVFFNDITGVSALPDSAATSVPYRTLVTADSRSERKLERVSRPGRGRRWKARAIIILGLGRACTEAAASSAAPTSWTTSASARRAGVAFIANIRFVYIRPSAATEVSRCRGIEVTRDVPTISVFR